VTAVSHAETALEMLRARKDGDQFDLVISDVHMPDMDGFKLVELVGLEMDIPVISKALRPRTCYFLALVLHGGYRCIGLISD
jgi:two-component response regulator ARR-B family